MKMAAAALLALLAATGHAATAYVSDELILGVYPDTKGQGQRLATLHSGAAVETLAVSGEVTQVRLSDGTEGWVKSSYLVTVEPATVRVKRLEDELMRIRATSPALAEAAQRSEAARLRRELSTLRQDGDHTVSGASSQWRLLVLVAAGSIACGFWLGYLTLARRIKHKFGGLKVY